MGLSIGHILIVLIIVLVLFGAGKLPRVMGDMGRGIRSFKDGLSTRDEDERRITDERLRDTVARDSDPVRDRTPPTPPIV